MSETRRHKLLRYRRDPIAYVNGVPRWFARLSHIWSARECDRKGHVGAGVCARCGHLLDPELFYRSVTMPSLRRREGDREW